VQSARGALPPAFLAGAWTASLGWFVGLGFGARVMAPVFARPAAWRALDVLILWAIALMLLRTGIL